MDLNEVLIRYLAACVEDNSEAEVMLTELKPLIKQINYSSLSSDQLQEITDKLGFGKQAQLILCNIISIWQVCNNQNIGNLLKMAGVEDDVIGLYVNNNAFAWVAGGLVFITTGVFQELESIVLNGKRSNTDRSGHATGHAGGDNPET